MQAAWLCKVFSRATGRAGVTAAQRACTGPRTFTSIAMATNNRRLGSSHDGESTED